MCPGYLAFVEQKCDGIESLAMGRLAIGLEILDPDLIPNLDPFDSIEQMLADHQYRLTGINPNISQ